MRISTAILIVAILLTACENNSGNSTTGSQREEQNFTSQNIDGKWTVDRATAEELKGMKNTLENFTLLNSKKYENLPAYQEYALLLENHIERVTTFCRLDKETKNALCKNLDRIKEQMEILKGDDMEKSHEAMEAINRIFGEIDSSFNYNN
ncbi:MAG: hypothetical protein KIS94_07145 [Chitinophagales bacterium]|nr:hypothetical protein [Chitinophagales bacterium]